MVNLQLMAEREFGKYKLRLIQEYANEQVKSGAWQPTDAAERARAEIDEMLPEGLSTPKHYLFSVMEDSVESPVGALWIFLRERNMLIEAFISDLVIFESFRRRGFASQALTELDAKAKELGAAKIRLQVFGHNHAARMLYEKIGYATVNVYMDKRLK
jgi:ribosomal protein S18 acetylase RimI-like enzyme